MDFKNIRSDFPLLANNSTLIFADNASTTQKPRTVIEAISHYYENYNANVHRAVYDLGITSDALYESTRNDFCDFYQKEACIFTNGTTDGLNKIARSCRMLISEKDNIVVSEMEHHSNLLPWQELCKEKGIELRVCNITSSGDLDLNHLEQLVDNRTRVVSLVHVSNTLGTINDLAEVGKMLSNRECVFIVDAAQSCTLYQKEIMEINADAFVFGGHKMFGPTGVGVILAKKSFLSHLSFFDLGGGMVKEVNHFSSSFRDDITRFEAGTPPIAQIVGLKAALDYIKLLDLAQCKIHVYQLALALRKKLKNHGITCLGDPAKHTGIVSVDFSTIHPHDAATFLNSKNIAVRAGHHCTQLIMKKFKIHASTRFSFMVYNDMSEVDKIVEAILEMKAFFE